MSPRLIISDNRDDPGNPLILDGDAIEGAAQDPVAIRKLMVDQFGQRERIPEAGACTTSATAISIDGCRPLRRAAKTS